MTDNASNSAEQAVNMVRVDLDNLPRFEWPADFSLRPFQVGAEQVWWEIHERADPLLAHRGGTHRHFFGADFDELRARQFFLIAPDGRPVGTASAWHDSPNVGRVHWIAIVPEFQGRGLAKPLSSQVLLKLQELGHRSAVLDTSLERPRAIALYKNFGFTIE